MSKSIIFWLKKKDWITNLPLWTIENQAGICSPKKEYVEKIETLHFLFSFEKKQFYQKVFEPGVRVTSQAGAI